MKKLYIRTPLFGNEFKVCDEITDECVAIFFNQDDAQEYVANQKTNSKGNKMKKSYIRVPLFGNEFKVCDEYTDECVAIFFNQDDAQEYVAMMLIKKVTK